MPKCDRTSNIELCGDAWIKSELYGQNHASCETQVAVNLQVNCSLWSDNEGRKKA